MTTNVVLKPTLHHKPSSSTLGFRKIYRFLVQIQGGVMTMVATSYPILYTPILNAGTLVSPEPALEANPRPTKKCKVHTGFSFGRVCLRSGPGTNYAPYATVSEGQQIELLDQIDPFWLHIRADGTYGYILHKYVEYSD